MVTNIESLRGKKLKPINLFVNSRDISRQFRKVLRRRHTKISEVEFWGLNIHPCVLHYWFQLSILYPTKGVEMGDGRTQRHDTTTLSGKAYGMEEDALGGAGGGGGACSGSLKVKSFWEVEEMGRSHTFPWKQGQPENRTLKFLQNWGINVSYSLRVGASQGYSASEEDHPSPVC